MHRLCKVIRLSLNNIRAYWHRVPLQVMYLEYTVSLCSVLVKGNWHGSIHEKTIRIIQNMEHSTKLAWILQTWNMRDQEKKAEGLLILGEIGQWQPNAKHKWLDLGFKKKKQNSYKACLGTTGDIWMDCVLDYITELMRGVIILLLRQRSSLFLGCTCFSI